ncbi:uncharacterized protein [Diadema setosum]|uniref:uncharacterized protein n=1 Tax=Diadema setosum TaxID=31175 RepID=UPI003B3BA286
MVKTDKAYDHEPWGTNDILFDPPSSSSKSYGLHQSGAMQASSGQNLRSVKGGRFRQGLFSDISMRRDEDESQYLESFNSGVAKILAVMQIIMGVVIVLIGVFAYVAEATIGPLIPAMDIGCAVVLYITGGVLGMFTRCKAKRLVAAFVILSACSLVSSAVLGSIHALAGFRTDYICAYLHCGTSAEDSPRKVMDALISILSFLESVFALLSMCVGFQGFCCPR